MIFFRSVLALAGFCGVLAGTTGNCVGANCPSQLEDAAMVQLARPGVKAVGFDASKRKSFARNTKPYLGEPGVGLADYQHGAIKIMEDGVENTYYLPGANIVDGGKTVKFTPPYRFYLMKSPTTDYSNANNFYKPYFPGKTFTVDMDFRQDGPSCGCNLNFYLVDMPVGFPGTDHDYYCDAQCFAGKGCCEEFDMNEGNMNVQQITNHACTGGYADHPDWACHKWGEPEEKTHGTEFGKGSQYTIDSTKPFTFSQRFDVEGGSFKFTTTMTQEGRQVVKTMGPGNSELDNMLKVLEKGMAFVTGYWAAGDMNWMDGEACGSGPEHCNMHPAYISNWRITSNSGGPAPVPGPSPEPAPVPPAPAPAPAPVPNPPSPQPTEPGRCCWGTLCNDCQNDVTVFCSQSVENCWACRGAWCPLNRHSSNPSPIPDLIG